ncbi:hypothetical protein DFJ74DRAFT_704643 [Hyaloraphidium curvatum]|nr:hypothetical protein DFJ74DRAFT_704643 [Hyaloraphidium curvatum]
MSYPELSKRYETPQGRSMVPPRQYGTSFGSLLRGGNITESIQNIGLVYGTIFAHVFIGIPVTFALLAKNVFLSLFGLTSRPRTPRSIVVIGASSGIGQALAVTYSKPGVNLLLIARNEERLERTANECRRLGAEATIRSIDIAAPDSPLESALQEFEATHPIDLLIDIAGIVTTTQGDKEEAFEDQYRAIYATNTLGMIRAAMGCVKLMRNRQRNRGGQVAIMSSIEAFMAYPPHVFYASSRAATDTLGKDLRFLLRKDDIFVSTIYPGAIESKMTNSMLAADKSATLPPWALKNTKRTAELIKQGLEKDSAHIGVPFSEYAVAFIQRTLPSQLDELVTSFQAWANPMGSTLT